MVFKFYTYEKEMDAGKEFNYPLLTQLQIHRFFKPSVLQDCLFA